MADTTSTGVSAVLGKFKKAPKEKEVKLSAKERRARFQKRLENLSKEEQAYLKRKRAFEMVWPI